MKDLYKLIEQAIVKSPEFKEKLTYWAHVRNKQISQDWLYKQLLEVFGTQEELTKQLKAIKESN